VRNYRVLHSFPTRRSSDLLTSAGATTPARWSVAGGATTMTVNCTTGAYTPDQTIFTIGGVAAATDVNFIRVQMVYAAAGLPPSQLQCSNDASTTIAPCQRA